MEQNAITFAVISLAVVFCSVGYFTRKKGFLTLSDFFFSGRNTRPSLVTSFLVSGSFSLNGMLYQIYLGYKIGVWALITQAAWSISFILLAIFATRISSTNGLHAFLGSVYSNRTRVVAAASSVVGLGLQIGWEYNVTKSAISGLTPLAMPPITLITIVLAIFAIGTFYTLAGGLRSNLWTDLFQNVLKGACFLVLCALLFAVAPEMDLGRFTTAALRPWSAAVAELAIVGLLSNIAFSLVWQFVDLSTWQAAVAIGKQPGRSRRSLISAGLWVFVAPGILGTLIGIGLSGHADLTSDTVLPALMKMIGSQPWVVFTLTISIATSALSFVDTMMLGIGLTLVTDVLFRSTIDRHRLLEQDNLSLSEDFNYRREIGKIIGVARLTLLGAAVAGTLLIGWVSDRLGVSLFDLVYIVVVSQLALFGPVIVGLTGRKPQKYSGIGAIVSALMAGYGLALYGSMRGSENMVNAASLLSLFLSLAVAWSCSTRLDGTPMILAQRQT